jgi:hypothetical protein
MYEKAYGNVINPHGWKQATLFAELALQCNA